MFESGFKVDIIKLYTCKNTSHGQGKSLNYFPNQKKINYFRTFNVSLKVS